MATSAELQDVQQGILRKKNVDEANFEAAAGTTVAQYTEELIERAETSTQAVVIMFDAITGKVPTSASLDVQAALAQAQFDDYAAKGVATPALGPYEALGRSLSSTAGFHAQSDGLQDGQFIINAYVKAFGVTPGAAQIDHFQAQLDYFEGIYQGAGISAADAALQARGAVYGQIFGFAALVEDGPLDTAAENFLRGTVTGTAIYDAPLSASQPAGPDPDQQIFALTQQTDAGVDFFGDIGDDIYNAEVIQTGLLPIQTLNSTDNLDGGDNRDTLNAQLVNAFTVPAGLKSIEVLNVDGAPGFVTPPVTLDVVNADSIDTIGLRSPTNNVTINNLKTALSNINISNTNLALAATITTVGSALAGTSDALQIDLNNVGQTGDTNLVLNAATGGYDSLVVNSTGGIPNNFNVFGSAQDATSVVIVGDTDLNINSPGGNAWNTGFLGLLDASSFTGNLNTDFAGAGSITVHGGSAVDDLTFWATGGTVVANGNDGDDLIRLGVDDVFAANVTKATLNAGDGNDTLSSLSTGPVSLNGDAGDDELRFNELGGGVTFSADDAANGGDGNDLLVIEADNDGSVLLATGVGAKITGIETIRHEGTLFADIDLNVNMAETGSSNLVVLAGSGALGGNDYDNVNVTNMTNAQTLEIRDDIEEDLNLNHASAVIQTFNLTFVGGVTVDSVDDENNNVVGEIDGYFISSIGGGTNTITNADEMTADVAISGNTNFVLGSDGGRYEVNNALITGNQTGNVFTGNLTVFADNAHQTIVGGAGNDYIDGADGDDVVNLSAGGADDVVVSANEGNITLTNNADALRVNGFSANDQLIFDIGALGLEESNGTGVDLADGVIMVTLAFAETESGVGQSVNYVKLTTAVSGANTAADLYLAAIGAGSFDVDATTDNLLVTAYDATNQQLVAFTVDAGSLLDSFDSASIQVVATVGMSQSEYDAFNASNIGFQA